MSVAIYFHPEAYSTSGPKLMGRNAAGESFLRGYARNSTSSEFWIQVENTKHVQHFTETMRAAGRLEPIHVIQKHTLQQLSNAGVVWVSFH